MSEPTKSSLSAEKPETIFKALLEGASIRATSPLDALVLDEEGFRQSTKRIDSVDLLGLLRHTPSGIIQIQEDRTPEVID